MGWKKKPATLTPPFKSNRNDTEPWGFILKRNGEEAEFYSFTTEGDAQAQRRIMERLLHSELT